MKRPGAALAAAGMLLGLVAGCSSSGSIAPTSGEEGFVGGGAGAVTIIPADRRGDPVQLAGPLVGGGDFDVAAHRGTVLLLNVWGSWCAPCRREAPELARAWADGSRK